MMSVRKRAEALGFELHKNDIPPFDAEVFRAEALAEARENDKRAGHDADGREALYYGGIAPFGEAQEWWEKQGRAWEAENFESHNGVEEYRKLYDETAAKYGMEPLPEDYDGYKHADAIECPNIRGFAWFRSNPDAPDPAELWADLLTKRAQGTQRYHEKKRYVLVTHEDREHVAYFTQPGKKRRRWAMGPTLEYLTRWLDEYEEVNHQ
jgi:hypothetical protein